MLQRLIQWWKKRCKPAVAQKSYAALVAERENHRMAEARARTAKALSAIFAGQEVESLDVDGSDSRSLPEGMRVGRLKVDAKSHQRLPTSFTCRELEMIGSPIRSFPVDVAVTDRLNLSDSAHLTDLPAGLSVSSIVLRNCRILTTLPAGMWANFLDLEGCVFLEELPEDISVTLGRLRLRDCRRLRRLPASVGPLAQLDVAGCPLVSELPTTLVVTSWLDIGGTGIAALPPGCVKAELRWRGVPIDHRIAFRPHEITGPEILAERNAELRRVMLERVGFERFLADVVAVTLDEDTDGAGCPRRLLRVPMEGDEDLVCVSVRCPSTTREYLLRVPPTITTCHAAIAWTAGFDDPKAYRPATET